MKSFHFFNLVKLPFFIFFHIIAMGITLMDLNLSGKSSLGHFPYVSDHPCKSTDFIERVRNKKQGPWCASAVPRTKSAAQCGWNVGFPTKRWPSDIFLSGDFRGKHSHFVDFMIEEMEFFSIFQHSNTRLSFSRQENDDFIDLTRKSYGFLFRGGCAALFDHLGAKQWEGQTGSGCKTSLLVDD